MAVRRRVTPGALVAIVASLALSISAAADSRGARLHAVVIRVIDVDAIEVRIGDRVEQVRYIGISAPELLDPSRGPEPYRGAAREANRRLVEGKAVHLELGIQERDRKGALLAYVYVDGQFVNAELLRQGLAEVATLPPNVGHRQEFILLQRHARQTREGLWADGEIVQLYRPSRSGVMGARRIRTYFHPDDDTAWNQRDGGFVYFESEREASEAGYEPSFNYASYREREDRALRGDLGAVSVSGPVASNPVGGIGSWQGSVQGYVMMKALFSAAKYGRQSELERLLASGGSPDARGPGGETALHWAAAYGHRDVAELLLAKGAQVNATDGGGGTPLHYAAEEDQVELIRLLMEKGAAVDSQNANDMTPLHLAAARGHRMAVEVLLRHHATVDARDKAGSTPLHLASSYGWKDVVSVLLNAGADPMVKDADGNTALQLAAANDHADVTVLLKPSGGPDSRR